MVINHAVSVGKLRNLLEIGTTILVGIAAVVFLKTHFYPPATQAAGLSVPVPTTPLSLKGASTVGDPTAKAAMVIFTDFECPYCARLANETVPKVLEEFVATGRVLLAVRHNPLDSHPLAHRAATAALCAGEQGKFWEVHDLFFRNRGFGADFLNTLADSVGVHREAFQQCTDRGGSSQVDSDLGEARRLGVNRTPVSMVGRVRPDGAVAVTQVILGAQPLERFREALTGALDGR